MTRAQQMISQALLLLSAYLVCLFRLVPLPPKIQDEIVPVIPSWLLITIGSYLLFRLGKDVSSVQDAPGAHEKLLLEVDEAKAALLQVGITTGDE